MKTAENAIPNVSTGGAIFVTKMKYTALSDAMHQPPEGLMEMRLQHVEFTKQLKGGAMKRHEAHIITYCDVNKHRLISLLTNDMDSDHEEISPSTAGVGKSSCCSSR